MVRSLEWWKSDDAKLARCSQYLGHMLFEYKMNRREEFNPRQEPEYPAIFHYDHVSDTPYWVECKNRIHAMDYASGCLVDCHMNGAAKRLAA